MLKRWVGLALLVFLVEGFFRIVQPHVEDARPQAPANRVGVVPTPARQSETAPSGTTKAHRPRSTGRPSRPGRFSVSGICIGDTRDEVEASWDRPTDTSHDGQQPGGDAGTIWCVYVRNEQRVRVSYAMKKGEVDRVVRVSGVELQYGGSPISEEELVSWSGVVPEHNWESSAHKETPHDSRCLPNECGYRVWFSGKKGGYPVHTNVGVDVSVTPRVYELVEHGGPPPLPLPTGSPGH